MTAALVSGTNSLSARFGAITGRTITKIEYVEPGDDALDNLLAASYEGYASVTMRVNGSNSAGQWRVEVQYSEEAFGLEAIRWEITPSSMMERTTVDLNGDPIILSYAPAADWATELTGQDVAFAFNYTQYEDQTGEADVYIPSEEITGTWQFICTNGAFIDLGILAREWQNTINETEFFGHPKGNVLCLGYTIRMLGRRGNNDILVEMAIRFVTRPGAPDSMWGKGAGGWNTWQYWKDPNSGMIPPDVATTSGALIEVQHYALKDFTVLYAAET